MLSLIILFTLIGWICYEVGMLVWKHVFRSDFRNAWHYVGVGMMTVAIVARWWSLVGNISWHIQLLLLGITLYGAIRNKGAFFRLVWESKVIYIVTILPVAYFCSLQSISFDEAGYHASFIRWLNDYGIVKGLGNIHRRLAFNSTWHVLAAVFNGQYWLGRPLNQINGFFIVWVIMFFSKEGDQWKHVPAIRLFARLIIPFIFFPLIMVYHVMGPSADFAIIFWTVILLYEIYFHKEKQQGAVFMAYLLMLLVFLITVKLSFVISLLLVIPMCRALLSLNIRIKWMVIIAGLLVVAPWLIGSYLMSGFLVYPSINIPVHPVWKISEVLAKSDHEGIKLSPFMRWSNKTAAEMTAMGTIEKYKTWYSGLRINDKLMFAGALAGYLLMFVRVYKVRAGDFYKRSAIVIGLAGYVFILATSPDFRFAAGYIYFALTIVIVQFNRWKFSYLLVALICFAELAGSLILYKHFQRIVLNGDTANTRPLALKLWLPFRYPVTNYETVVIDGFPFHLYDENKKEFIWDNNPGMNERCHPALLGKTFKDGFYLKDQ